MDAPPGAPRWRVEELAARADVSVDTIRFYQKRRLLPPPEREGRIAWYGSLHLERLTRIRDLQAQGLTLTLIARLLSGEIDPTDVPLAAAVAAANNDADSPEELLTLAELSARSGVPLPLLEAVAREGLLLPRVLDGREHYTDADVAIVRQGLSLLERGLPLPELLALAREHTAGTREVAEQAVALFDEHVRQPLRAADLPDDEKAEQLVAAFRVLLPTITALVAHHFQRVLLAVAQEHLERVGHDTELAAASAEAGRRLESSWPP
jgi:DNA-binding transcriptional MerR regulator